MSGAKKGATALIDARSHCISGPLYPGNVMVRTVYRNLYVVMLGLGVPWCQMCLTGEDQMVDQWGGLYSMMLVHR